MERLTRGKRAVSAVLVLGVIGGVLLAGSATAAADRGWDHDRRHRWDRRSRWDHHDRRDRGRPGRATIVLPRTSVKIVFGGRPFYYDRGVFYRRRVFDYVVVRPPIGTVVREVPADCERVVINGVTYLNYDGVYYKSGPAGYTVVSLPIANGYGADPVQIASAPSGKHAGDAITINVPNKNGSYTPVELREINGTYVGPRGEVYPTKPELRQLEDMYGQ
jgi:hypothetical protein